MNLNITSNHKCNIIENTNKLTIELEVKLRIKFTKIYKCLLIKYNNFTIGDSELIYGLGFRITDTGQTISNIYEKNLEIRKFYINLPSKIVVFCPTGDGSEWAFDYSNLNTLGEPKIVLLDHEQFDQTNLHDLEYIINYYNSLEDWVQNECN
jgi:SMI1-KNR4 cell-wall